MTENEMIFRAVKQGDTNRVKLMVERNPKLAKVIAPDGWPLLRTALYYNRPNIATFLIERGADLHATVRSGPSR